MQIAMNSDITCRICLSYKGLDSLTLIMADFKNERLRSRYVFCLRHNRPIGGESILPCKQSACGIEMFNSIRKRCNTCRRNVRRVGDNEVGKNIIIYNWL